MILCNLNKLNTIIYYRSSYSNLLMLLFEPCYHQFCPAIIYLQFGTIANRCFICKFALCRFAKHAIILPKYLANISPLGLILRVTSRTLRFGQNLLICTFDRNWATYEVAGVDGQQRQHFWQLFRHFNKKLGVF